MVGNSGTADERFTVLTPSAFSLPLLTCGSAGGRLRIASDTSPVITPSTADGAPLYGTCTILILAMVRNSSPERCAVLPLPPEPKLRSPGRALAITINSFTDFTGSEGCTIKMFGADDTSDTGAKSFCGS